MDEISDIDLEELEQEAPNLMQVRRLAEGLTLPPWFANVGAPPSPGVRAAAENYLNALGFPDAGLAILPDWEDAADAAETLDWQSAAWEAEELARADLTGRALDALSEEALQIGLAMVSQTATEAIRAGAEESAALWDAADEAAQRAAIGAAVHSCNTSALLLLASAADPDFEADAHAFAYKHQLFELGRWPVSVAGASFNLF